jgi:NitT/TauT family transport system permease protein
MSFFPITTAMVTGLRAPDRIAVDLLRTYDASRRDVFVKLRWPAAMGFLFAGVKVAATLALVGAIVAELPTGAQAGLGARLLAGSYYGQTLQIWAALAMASLLTLLAVGAAETAQRVLVARRGGRL